MPFFDAQGTTFTFSGTTFTVTNVEVKWGGSLLEVSNLNIGTGKGRQFQAPALRDDEITVDYFALNNVTAVTVGASGTLSFNSPAGNYVKNATVSSSSYTYATGELVKGNLTFKVDA